MPRPAAPLLLRKIFAAPLVIALLSLVGLVVALTGDGPADVLSWGCLAAPVAAIIWARRTRRT